MSREEPFENIWKQPAAGDAGGALGGALAVWHQFLGNDKVVTKNDTKAGSYLGPEYSQEEIEEALTELDAVYHVISNEKRHPKCPCYDTQFSSEIAKELVAGKVVGWFLGRMEFGPRALGNRSIIGDLRNEKMQSTMNLKIKYRESFRPFAPSILAEHVQDYFEMTGSSPYMLHVAEIKDKHRIEMSETLKALFGIEKLKIPRSTLPSITHVDYSSRIQTVHEETNPRYHELISAFNELTGCPVLVNTSFNVRGEPIVCTPEDAYRCFMRTEMDVLVINNIVLRKENQTMTEKDESWRNEFALD